MPNNSNTAQTLKCRIKADTLGFIPNLRHFGGFGVTRPFERRKMPIVSNPLIYTLP